MSLAIENIAIKKLEKDDLQLFIEVIQLFVDVFEREDFSMPDSNHLEKVLQNDSFYVFCVISDRKVIGGITIYVQEQYYTSRPLAYIYDLAIANNYQRQGIGKKLLSHINHFCKENGFEETYVPAEKADDHAVDFYRSTKPTYEQEVIHFSYLLNKKPNL
ncbi:GNAT family N-acetyltransferase [Ekhidna sp. To15]|uniref:GNAT family N-acetyltransferase n=1 Tax=Ekhidna sp. To15 TaxID=3395267 RepID=UPI003F51E12F